MGTEARIKKHEEWIKNNLDKNTSKDKLEYHLLEISWLQHERLIHLLVTITVTVFLVVWFFISTVITGLLAGILTITLIVVEIFYILHYCKLENTVHRWYTAYEDNIGK